MSLIVKVGKAGKRVVKKFLPEEKHHVSYTRRIERVKTRERVVAMTFDDGPMDLPSSPDKFDGKALTDILLDTLGEYGAQGTFDVVGDTSENYPDTAGKSGQADWGGVRYDHYPDINQDERGGAVHNQRLLRRMLDEGHQVTNHGYRHVLFGKKPFVYGKRDHFHGLDQVVSDLTRLHTLLKETYGYEMTMARPPHYVDKIEGGFTSYDAYDQMGYLYLAAAFDGAGWLPLHHGSAQESLRAEVEAMVDPMRKVLEADPDGLAGQIIFQKDGYNMCRRTPVAFGLKKQLPVCYCGETRPCHAASSLVLSNSSKSRRSLKDAALRRSASRVSVRRGLVTITSGIGQSLLQCGPSGSSAHSVQRPARIQKLPSSSQIA